MHYIVIEDGKLRENIKLRETVCQPLIGGDSRAPVARKIK